LLSVDAATQIQFANLIIAKRLSVRDTEKMVAQAEKEPTLKSGHISGKAGVSRDTARMEEALSDQLGTKVTLKVGGKDRGQIVIDFHGWEHCSSLIEKMQLKTSLE
jgi:ParB family chromosome partitioning protein